MAAPLASPPPRRPFDDEPPQPPLGQRLKERFLNRRYLFIALAFHLLLFLTFGGKVLLQGMQPKKELFIASNTPDDNPPTPPPPPQPQPEQETAPVPTEVQQTATPDLIATDTMDNSFVMPEAVAPTPLDPNKPLAKAQPPSTSFNVRAGKIKAMTQGWGKDGQGPTGTGPSTHAKFLCYVAKANGIDPANYHNMDGDTIIGGPIPNMLRMINAWSGGKITAEAVAHPLDLASPEIFEKKPPFIYFTGFADFVLTDAEVANLRRYLMEGGALWGDNGLAGRGSRFDIAFRREMKRVLPDVDKQFEALPPDHPIFRGSESFYQLKDVPPGMNFRAEPVEGIKIDGDIAIIYTLNDYTDMMAAGYVPPIKQPGGGNVLQERATANAKTPWYTNRMYVFQSNSADYFRNFDPAASDACFQLATNIVVHLLTRFQSKLMFTN